MHGIRKLIIDEFREKNIVLSVNISEGANCDETTLKSLYEYEHVAADKKVIFINTLREEVNLHNLKLIEVIPSYGATLITVCEEYEIMEVETV